MHWPNRTFWEKHGFEVHGTDDSFSVTLPGWMVGIVAGVVFVVLRLVFKALFG